LEFGKEDKKVEIQRSIVANSPYLFKKHAYNVSKELPAHIESLTRLIKNAPTKDMSALDRTSRMYARLSTNAT
jgi:hypothetical protein